MGSLSENEKSELVLNVATVLGWTELGNNTSYFYQFSLAELGTSSYSFGLQQFDVGARADVRAFLKENGFTDDDIKKLSQHEAMSADDLKKLNVKLRSISSKVNAFSYKELRTAVDKLDTLITYVEKKNPKIAKLIKQSKRVQLALVDYDNQFHIGGLDLQDPPSNSMLAYLCGEQVSLAGGKLKLGDDVTAASIQNFIDRTTYGSRSANKKAVSSRKANLAQALDKVDPVKPAARTPPASAASKAAPDGSAPVGGIRLP
jgi:hypothetical protein